MVDHELNIELARKRAIQAQLDKAMKDEENHRITALAKEKAKSEAKIQKHLKKR